MAKPYMAGQKKYAERNIDIYGKRYETKRKTMEEIKGQRQRIIRRNWSRLKIGNDREL
jgi:hypothetical protein